MIVNHLTQLFFYRNAFNPFLKLRFCLVLIVLFPLYTLAQESNESLDVATLKQLEKEKKFAEKLIREEYQKKLTDSIIALKRFVLEAEYISGRSGSRIPVSPDLNFILIDSADATIQIGSATGMGYNGVGGITVDGRITKYKLFKKQHKKSTTYTLTLFFFSNAGSYDIQIWITGLGQADATIRGNTSGQLSFSGRIVPLDKSFFYKGSSYP